jgi:CheY-like chemotaxis protein
MLTILLAEDDKLLRDLATKYLRSSQCIVLEAGSAEEALALLASGHHADLLVTDVRMAGKMSGWDLAEAVHARDQNVRIVYTTSGARDPQRQIPGSTFIQKPYDVRALMAAINAATGSN